MDARVLDSSGCLWVPLHLAPADSPLHCSLAGNGTKTSRTTTMESSYVKRSDSKNFCCLFPAAFSGCNDGCCCCQAIPACGARRASLSSCPRPLSFCRWQQHICSNQVILQLIFQEDWQVSGSVSAPSGPCEQSACTNPICQGCSVPVLGCPQSFLVLVACLLPPVVPMGLSMYMETCLPAGDLKPPLFFSRDVEVFKAPGLAMGWGHFPGCPWPLIFVSISSPASLTVKMRVPPGRAAWLHWSGARLRRRRS